MLINVLNHSQSQPREIFMNSNELQNNMTAIRRTREPIVPPIGVPSGSGRSHGKVNSAGRAHSGAGKGAKTASKKTTRRTTRTATHKTVNGVKVVSVTSRQGSKANLIEAKVTKICEKNGYSTDTKFVRAMANSLKKNGPVNTRLPENGSPKNVLEAVDSKLVNNTHHFTLFKNFNYSLRIGDRCFQALQNNKARIMSRAKIDPIKLKNGDKIVIRDSTVKYYSKNQLGQIFFRPSEHSDIKVRDVSHVTMQFNINRTTGEIDITSFDLGD